MEQYLSLILFSTCMLFYPPVTVFSVVLCALERMQVFYCDLQQNIYIFEEESVHLNGICSSQCLC